MPQAPQARPVILEVRRKGRRPRYHQGYRVVEGGRATPEQCNLDQVELEVRELQALPEYPAMRRPWNQLCRRCFRGSLVLIAADRLRRSLAGEPEPEPTTEGGPRG
jgi:hypothetical protein